MATPADALPRLLEILDRAEIQYSIGGSVASSAHGIPRTTMDVDLVADIKPDEIDELTGLLGTEFYADATMMREAFVQLDSLCDCLQVRCISVAQRRL